MTIKDAYIKVSKLPNRKVLIDCLDIGEQWAFMFSDRPLEPDDHIVGGGYDAVNKKTGKITKIPTNPANWNILLNGKSIDIKQFQE